ncbi:DUF4191 domain-containing protein [uncultured Gardnerella sp.]|uniref:DUF4191 domain-containing protein n=1 Tax=uncultured Gardnerella sp. TaxID=293424 RepID=UPI0025D82CCA|nr:DUF4191 domain-containing protein [uncultured Gardnerella sp.]
MAKNNSDNTKTAKAKSSRNNIFSQIIRIYKYTHSDDKQLPWFLALAFLAPVVLGLIIGFLLHWSIVTFIMMMITAIMLGFLLFTIVLTKRADKVGYARLEGKSGAAIGILSSINKGGFSFPQQPIWVDPRTKDAIWRGTGHNGIFLIGEGNYERVMNAMNRQEQSIKHITLGSLIPVYKFVVGESEKEVKLKDLRDKVLHAKSYQQTNHKFVLLAKLHPRRRFFMTKLELANVNNRLSTLQGKSGFGIPKGIDPTKKQHISRRAMRGK